MRPSNKSRSRNKPGNSGNNPNNNNQRRSLGNIINRVFDSAGPDGKVRGTPQQIIDKYQALARDAQLAGDRVAAESFLQHSEHYSRMLGEAQASQTDMRQGYDRDDARRDDDQRGDGYADPPRDQQPRDPQTRDQQPRDLQPRDQQSRDQQPRDQQPRDQYRERPRPEPQPAIASSLTTIDTADDGEFGGLIETPESNLARPPAAPEPIAEQPVNGAVYGAAPEAPAAEEAPKPKRGRPRRKAPVEGDAPASAGE